MPTDSSDPAASTPDDSAEIPYPVVFRINRVAYFTVPMVALVVVLLLGASYWFAFLFVAPVALYMWIHRLRTVVTEDGVRAVGALSTTELPWSEIAGLQFPKWSSVRAVRPDGERVKLPAIGFRDLPVLNVVSKGRIPDPFEAAANRDK
ncbi:MULTISPECIES: PH domain-containing protein [Gordonia]|uniref:Low molecular weight protein antigen 6 PH domain-containing protein n=2 Tax=Gordonia alkanivorans TaxID=84096 RepID=F9VXD3_9ACTN|nr:MULTISPECIES: PH domain-containing protein [Gordonia]AZZ81589.1 PH domain-containing protein [Gordonia alkanivorans]ETA07442.1 hypothetical protein V525_08785 [Gordonia alkanivorans CGMCC 6845]MDH3007657.1 PH domain-containing protein [Gordonia alkanivorans]MDH3015540.1 PH domain-containing protein [Gordonia alkanivorans]MDH3020275.1 PH domain-containing protein [Gordonia alkanivorans]